MTSTSVKIFWQPPTTLNGRLTAYEVILLDIATETVVYSGLELTASVNNLVAGRTYTFYLEVGTGAGVTRSQGLSVTLPVLTPVNVPPPDTVQVRFVLLRIMAENNGVT